MTPLTQTLYQASEPEPLKALMPERLQAPYAYLLDKSLSSPELAAFTTYFLSAVLGNADAWKRVLEISLAAHALRHRLKSPEDVKVTNLMVAMVNVLADIKVRGEEIEPKPSPKPEVKKSEPVKKQQAKPKPASTFSKKPGLLAS